MATARQPRAIKRHATRTAGVRMVPARRSEVIAAAVAQVATPVAPAVAAVLRAVVALAPRVVAAAPAGVAAGLSPVDAAAEGAGAEARTGPVASANATGCVAA